MSRQGPWVGCKTCGAQPTMLRHVSCAGAPAWLRNGRTVALMTASSNYSKCVAVPNAAAVAGRLILEQDCLHLTASDDGSQVFTVEQVEDSWYTVGGGHARELHQHAPQARFGSLS